VNWPDRQVPFLANEETTRTAPTDAHRKPQDNIYLHICTVRPAHQNVLSFPQSWGGRRCRRHRRGRCHRTYFDPHGCVVSNRRMRDRQSVCANGPTAAIGALDAAALLAAVLTTPPLPMFAGARSKPAAATAAAVTAPSLVVPAPLCTKSLILTACAAKATPPPTLQIWWASGADGMATAEVTIVVGTPFRTGLSQRAKSDGAAADDATIAFLSRP